MEINKKLCITLSDQWSCFLKKTNPVTAVFSEFDPPDDLLVNEVGGDEVIGGTVPWREDLLPEEQPPGGVPLLGSLFLGVLLALRYGVHHVIISTA